MGIYINPTTDQGPRDKMATILQHAMVAFRDDFLVHNPGDKNMFGVCIVDNGWMVAAGVAYSKNEAEVFADPRDDRHKVFCLMTLDAIRELDPITAKTLERYVSE